MPQAHNLPSAWVIFVAFWVFLLAVFLTVAYINEPKYQAILADIKPGNVQKLRFFIKGEQIGEATSSVEMDRFVNLHKDLGTYQALTWNATDCALAATLKDGVEVTYEIHFDAKARQVLLTLEREQTWHIGGMGMGLYKDQGTAWYQWLMASRRFGQQQDIQYFCVMY